MQISKIKSADIAEYLRIEDGYNSPLLESIGNAAKSYIKSYTGMTDDEIDTHDEFYLAFMVLCQDMYDNRVMYVEKSNVNKVVESILDMHRKNLI